MWPSASGSGGASNPIWGNNQPQNPGGSNLPSGGSWIGPNSGGSGGGSNHTPGFSGPSPGGGLNPSAGGWFGPTQGGGSNPAPGWPGSGGGLNPSAGGWFGPTQGGGSNPAPDWPGSGGGLNPSAGGWFGPTQGGGSNPAPGRGSQPTTPSSRSSQVTPCLLDLPAGVYNGLLLTINGRIKAHPKKFTVDLSTRNDIAFHFNPRFNDCGDRNVVVRNSCRGKRWESEERQLSHFPFTPNTNFEMKILCTNNEYKVAVNGAHLLIFKHRITNLREINKVSIYYDVENISIKAETMH
uniref:Galectin n=2 Tax=Gouania willdenowi TaxID=441366 RepID=A0A8C5HR42_GOUWI